MLSLSKKKLNHEYIYVRKQNNPMFSLEDLLAKYKKSKNKIEEIVLFYTNMINFEKFTYITKLLCMQDGKKTASVVKIKSYIIQMITEAVENFINNPSDNSYVSDLILVIVSNYNGKHYISVCPRLDFIK